MPNLPWKQKWSSKSKNNADVGGEVFVREIKVQEETKQKFPRCPNSATAETESTDSPLFLEKNNTQKASLFLILQMAAPETPDHFVSSYSAQFPTLQVQCECCHRTGTWLYSLDHHHHHPNPPPHHVLPTYWPLWCMRMTSVMTSSRTTGMTSRTPMMMEGVKSEVSSSNSSSSMARCFSTASFLSLSFTAESCSTPAALGSTLFFLSENKVGAFLVHAKIITFRARHAQRIGPLTLQTEETPGTVCPHIAIQANFCQKNKTKM